MSEFNIYGFEETVRSLRQLPQEIAGKVLDAAVRKAGTPMAQDASRTAPRSDAPSRAGHMADAIKLRKFTDQDSGNDLESNYWIGPDRAHFYATFSEFGTIHESARPFMRPSFDRDGRTVIEVLGLELGAGVERAAKRLAG